MSEGMDERLAQVAEVLIRHQRIPTWDGAGGQRCVGCDNLHGESDGPNSPRHMEHQAQALAPLLTQWQAEDKAEAERLRAEIEALADDLASEVDWSNGRSNYGDNAAWESAARRLRALLAGETNE